MFEKLFGSGSYYLIVGLGNPGKKYENTRHNTGFMALDYIAQKNGIKVTRARFSSLTGTGRIKDQSVVLQKPTTFMNSSGTAVLELTRYYGIAPQRVIVIYDDVSLAPGQLRIRAKGSAGGHNGIKSIIEFLDSDEFLRIKIGVGAKHENEDLADRVLSAPSAADRKAVEGRLCDVEQAVRLIMADRLAEAQDKFN
ncbi:MAG: aminoacyl-tRNA hydrolase [Oscillospiraceae bacterium]